MRSERDDITRVEVEDKGAVLSEDESGGVYNRSVDRMKIKKCVGREIPRRVICNAVINKYGDGYDGSCS